MTVPMNEDLKNDLREYDYQDALDELEQTRPSWMDRKTWPEFCEWGTGNLLKKDEFAKLTQKIRGAYPDLGEIDLMDQFLEHLNIARPRFKEISEAEKDGWWVGYDTLDGTWKRAYSEDQRPAASGEDVDWVST